MSQHPGNAVDPVKNLHKERVVNPPALTVLKQPGNQEPSPTNPNFPLRGDMGDHAFRAFGPNPDRGDLTDTLDVTRRTIK